MCRKNVSRDGLIIAAVLLALLGLLLMDRMLVAVQHPEFGDGKHTEPALHQHQAQQRLLLATDSRLLWYYPATDTAEPLHVGEGVHYGMFPGGGEPARTVWTVLRPHHRQPMEPDALVEIDMQTGAVVRRAPIPTLLAHDTARAGNRVYVTDPGGARLLELSFPDMAVVRSMDLFEPRDQPNTLAALAPNNLLVVLGGAAQSDVVRVDTSQAEPQIIGRVSEVGRNARGLVAWEGAYVMLDSDGGQLVLLEVNASSSVVQTLWQEAPGQKSLLSGLAVLDDIAYFGVCPSPPADADAPDPHPDCELAAFELTAGLLLWRRKVDSGGQINTVGAPHIDIGSTFEACYTPLRQAEGLQVAASQELAAQQEAPQAPGDYPSQVDSYWSSGWPMLNSTLKNSTTPWAAGLQLPLFIANVSELREAVAVLPEEVWSLDYQARHSAVVEWPDANPERHAPGVQSLILMYSAPDGEGPVFAFPPYQTLAHLLEPLLEEILGTLDVTNVIRLKLVRMLPGTSDVQRHRKAAGHAVWGHRLHVPLITNDDAAFELCPAFAGGEPPHQAPTSKPCHLAPMPEGLVSEVNSQVPYVARNRGAGDRIHLVLEVAESERWRVDLQPGSVCDCWPGGPLTCRQPPHAAL